MDQKRVALHSHQHHSRLILDVLQQGQRLPVDQQQELADVGAAQRQIGLQHEHLGSRDRS